MLKSGAKILGAVGLLLSVTATADVIIYDLLPWPWGSECPFPWTRIEGDWVVRSGERHDRFTFSVKGTWDNGTRVLEVLRYDSRGRLIGTGEGVAPRGERIVRAAMSGQGSEKGKTYWALVRSYVEKRKMSCAKGKLVTVITLRPTDGASPDVHLIVERDEDEPKESQP
jgi:hypothetical protein